MQNSSPLMPMGESLKGRGNLRADDNLDRLPWAYDFVTAPLRLDVKMNDPSGSRVFPAKSETA